MKPAAPRRRIAFFVSNALGDTLVSMIIVHHLRLGGAQVTAFGGPVYALRHWFPGADIRPLPDDSDRPAVLAGYDQLVQMHAHQPVADLHLQHPQVRILEPLTYSRHGGRIADRFVRFCGTEWGLADTNTDNGIGARSGFRYRQHRQRVVIHPEASTPDKRWSSSRFIEVARRLRQQGYDVNFVTAPHERKRWSEVERANFALYTFGNLDALAGWLYESGWFIGNDSGVGHLAANLGIPTLTLFRRRAVAERWRPTGHITEIVLPWQWIPTAWLKERCWRQTLTCTRVLRAFGRLTVKDMRQAPHDAGQEDSD